MLSIYECESYDFTETFVLLSRMEENLMMSLQIKKIVNCEGIPQAFKLHKNMPLHVASIYGAQFY